MDRERQTRDEESLQGLLQDEEHEEFELTDNSEDTASSTSSRLDHENEKQPDDKGPRYNLSSSKLALLVIGKSIMNYF
jgi:hypothetical protein